MRCPVRRGRELVQTTGRKGRIAAGTQLSTPRRGRPARPSRSINRCWLT